MGMRPPAIATGHRHDALCSGPLFKRGGGMSRKQGLPERGRGFGGARSRGPLAGCDRGAGHWARRIFRRTLCAPPGSDPHEWGPSFAVRRAPCNYGDLTAKADEGGRQPHASISGRIPINDDVAPAPPRRPPHLWGCDRPRLPQATDTTTPATPTYGKEVAA